jgi:hypothetical protein
LHGLGAPFRAVFDEGGADIEVANSQFCFFAFGEWFEFYDDEDVGSLRTVSVTPKVKDGSYSHLSYIRAHTARERGATVCGL